MRLRIIPAWETFARSPRNPILSPRDLPFRAVAALNPGAAEQDGQVVLLVRVEEVNGFSDVYAARGRDGVTNWKLDDLLAALEG